MNYIDFINDMDFDVNHIILIVRVARASINAIREYFVDVVIDQIRITSQHIFSYLFRKYKQDDYVYSDWYDEIFYLNKFIPKIGTFIINNYDFYNSIKNDQVLLYKFIISCVFQEINEDLFSNNFIIYLIEKFIKKDSLIYNIFNHSDLENLKNIFVEVIKQELESEEVYNYLFHLILNKNLKDLYNLLISLLILSETKSTPLILADLRDIQQRADPLLIAFNINSLSNQIIEALTDLARRFFNYEIHSEKIYQIKNFITPFQNSILIQKIEYNKNFFLSFFQTMPFNETTYQSISSKKTLYSVLIAFGNIIFKKLFRLNIRLGTIDDFKIINDTELAQINYFMNLLRDNIYFKINLKEFLLHLQFLEKIIEFYQRYHIFTENLNSEQSSSYNFDKWKETYEYFIVPLDTLYIHISEIKRLIWHIDNYEKMVIILKKKIEELVKLLSLDFMNFLNNNYMRWVSNTSTGPVSVVNVFERFFKPGQTPISRGDYHLFLIIDCCPLSIWEMIKSKILQDFEMIGVKSIIGTSILPTSTRWARRALASGKYPIAYSGRWLEADDFCHLISGFPFHRLTSKPSLESSYYVSHCELLDMNDKAIRMVSNTINFQYCVFNISDESSHNFDLNTVLKIVELTYFTKIKPLIKELLSKKTKVVIYFATDHGITKILEYIDWSGTNFQNYKNSSIIDNRNAHPRFFISETPLQPTKNDILKIESNQNSFGLKHFDYGTDRYYYFATRYENFKIEPGDKNVYFAHGGASFFEFLIPFAILSQKLKKEKPEQEPTLTKNIVNTDCEIVIQNPFDISITKVKVHLFFKNYYFKYFINEIKENDSFKLTRNALSNENSPYKYVIEYFFAERYFSTLEISVEN